MIGLEKGRSAGGRWEARAKLRIRLHRGDRPAGCNFDTSLRRAWTRIRFGGCDLSWALKRLFLWECARARPPLVDWPPSKDFRIAVRSGPRPPPVVSVLLCRPAKRRGPLLPKAGTMPARPARRVAHQSREDFQRRPPARCRQHRRSPFSESSNRASGYNLRAQPGRRGDAAAHQPLAITGEGIARQGPGPLRPP